MVVLLDRFKDSSAPLGILLLVTMTLMCHYEVPKKSLLAN